MYAVIQRYSFEPARAEVIQHQLHTGFAPLLRRLPGFAAFYWLESNAGIAASLSVWEDAVAAEHAVSIAADFVAKNLAGELGTPEITTGEIRMHLTSGL